MTWRLFRQFEFFMADVQWMKGGMLEGWNIGMMEWWNAGMMERWKDGKNNDAGNWATNESPQGTHGSQRKRNAPRGSPFSVFFAFSAATQ
jgi:hypothetical protein